MNTSSNIQANVIDGITRPDNIADYAESVILIKCGEYLTSSDNHFDFK